MRYYPTVAVLGGGYTGKTGQVGYALYSTTAAPVQGFSTANVIETTELGTYTVASSTTEGVPLPDGFAGRIHWGVTQGAGILWLASEAVVPAQVASYLAGQDPATAVWNALAATFNTAGTMGEALNKDPQYAASAMWDVPSAQHQVPGSMGSLVNLIVPISTSDAVVAGTTTSLQFAGSVALAPSDGFYDGAFLCFIGGLQRGIARQIGSYDGGSRTFTLITPFPLVPQVGDPFILVGSTV
jgi:hypothetical protein